MTALPIVISYLVLVLSAGGTALSALILICPELERRKLPPELRAPRRKLAPHGLVFVVGAPVVLALSLVSVISLHLSL